MDSDLSITQFCGENLGFSYRWSLREIQTNNLTQRMELRAAKDSLNWHYTFISYITMKISNNIQN